jgi:hypothetical protein
MEFLSLHGTGRGMGHEVDVFLADNDHVQGQEPVDG